MILVWSGVRSKSEFTLKNLKKGIKVNFKGSWKDPFLYLRTLSFILFLTLILGAGSIFKPPLQQGEFSFFSTAVSESFERFDDQNLFICRKEKAEPLGLNLIEENSLLGISSPATLSFQVLASFTDSQDFWAQDSVSGANEVTEYLVQSGDTLSTLSQKFGISLNTIAWANNLSKNSAIQPGQKLIILPVSGVLHHVKNGDTLGEIARTYKADTADIVSLNELSNGGEIYIGDILVIPNGTMPSNPAPVYPQVPLASSYFICPIGSPCRITQGLHWYNAIDFSNGQCGSSIYAAAGGQVIKVKYGWNQGAGNTIAILHPNGVITSYGHLQTILVSQGDTVSQGQIIALMGGQPGMPGAGKSTGCHVHFGVQGAKNPFAR